MFSVAAYLVETRMGEQVYSGSPSLSGVHGPHENSFFFSPSSHRSEVTGICRQKAEGVDFQDICF